MTHAAPVGVFDSGVGGLTVLREIRRLLPNESLLYCADTRYAPYGKRSEAFVIDRSLAVSEWLVAQGAKAIVVACNTATTIAIAAMRATLDVPVIGVEPGVKPAVQASQTGTAGILATAGTLKSDKFKRLITEHSGNCRLICTAGIGLVEAIEQGDTDTALLRSLLRQYLQPMLDAGADTLALGCTHYPLLIPLIEQIAGDRLRIVDNSTPVVRQLARQLDAHGLTAAPLPFSASAAASVRLLATGATAPLQHLARTAAGLPDSVAHVVDISSPATDTDAPSDMSASPETPQTRCVVASAPR